MPGPRLALSYRGTILDVIPVIGTDLLEQTIASVSESLLYGPRRQGQHPGKSRRDAL